MYGSRGRRQDLGGPVVTGITAALPALPLHYRCITAALPLHVAVKDFKAHSRTAVPPYPAQYHTFTVQKGFTYSTGYHPGVGRCHLKGQMFAL